MILVDYNAIAISNVVTQKLEIEENLLRHMILNSMRSIRKRFSGKYGELVICCDGQRNWRFEAFPQYKHKRKEGRKESSIDWNEVFRITNMVRDELRDNFQYKVLWVNECEADDIIGYLSYRTQEFGQHEEVMIISADKDFGQLQKFSNIHQYSPMQSKFIQIDNPRLQLMELILKGDASDGVPNVLSEDNVFVEGIRQTPLSKKKMEEIITDYEEGELLYAASWYRNFQRNQLLIDLSKTPENVKQKIEEAYINEGDKSANKSKVLGYLMDKKCNMLLREIEDFIS